MRPAVQGGDRPGPEGGVWEAVLPESGGWLLWLLRWIVGINQLPCNDWKVYLKVDIALANTGVSRCCNRG